MKQEKCRSCGAPIIWAVTKRGKRMPVDAQASIEGTIALQEMEDGTVRAIVAGPPPALFYEPRHTSHFATCPEASKWRRK